MLLVFTEVGADTAVVADRAAQRQGKKYIWI